MFPGRNNVWQQMKLFLAKVLWIFDPERAKGIDASFDDDFRLYAKWKR
ncbi:hypothetical protein ANO14919_078080 [Xylariales sp. No.14919]|nr:hypothetical protein ANO14919_078080 [Xylariales sp. No.14919]